MKVDISIKPIVYNLLNKRLKTIENKIYKELNQFRKEIFKLWERLRYIEDEIKISQNS